MFLGLDMVGQIYQYLDDGKFFVRFASLLLWNLPRAPKAISYKGMAWFYATKKLQAEYMHTRAYIFIYIYIT
jgi:hypothetical protein